MHAVEVTVVEVPADKVPGMVSRLQHGMMSLRHIMTKLDMDMTSLKREMTMLQHDKTKLTLEGLMQVK